jgi:formamidopyrimidine-DNA glycosylase
MPELPEVETVCRGLEKALKGSHITKVDVRRPDLRTPLPKNLAARLKGQRILGISRRAKYILITLDRTDTLLRHLGMSRRMVLSKGDATPTSLSKHDHLIFSFSNGVDVRFNDPRRFGLCDLVSNRQLPNHKFLRHLGIEPLEHHFTAAFLEKRLKGKKASIKEALLDQRLVVGVGNIYASEALFHAGINPQKQAGRCTKDQLARLAPAIKKVLRAAIKAGGSTLRDYVRVDGELGYFQHHFAVYDREGKPCPNCQCDLKKTGGIQRITQGGRSTFYCPTKQI